MHVTDLTVRGSILHIYATHTSSHIRELVPANANALDGFINEVVAVPSGKAGFSIDTTAQAASVATVKAWWRVLLDLGRNRYSFVIFHGAYWPKVWHVAAASAFLGHRVVIISWGAEILPHTRPTRFIDVRQIALSQAFGVVFLSNSDLVKAKTVLPPLTHRGVISYYNSRHARRSARPSRSSPVSLQVGNDASAANSHIDCLKCLDNHPKLQK